MSDELPPLKPLSKQRQLKNARYVLKMQRDHLEDQLKDLVKIKDNTAACMDRIERAIIGYLRAYDELDQLTTKRK